MAQPAESPRPRRAVAATQRKVVFMIFPMLKIPPPSANISQDLFTNKKRGGGRMNNTGSCAPRAFRPDRAVSRFRPQNRFGRFRLSFRRPVAFPPPPRGSNGPESPPRSMVVRGVAAGGKPAARRARLSRFSPRPTMFAVSSAYREGSRRNGSPTYFVSRGNRHSKFLGFSRRGERE